MKKIILIFTIILLVIPSVIASFGGSQPGTPSSDAGAGGGISGGGLLVQGGDSVTLGIGEYATIEVHGRKYQLKVLDIEAQYVLISITPTGIEEKINLGATRRFDLSGNKVEDFLVKFRTHKGSKVVLNYLVVAERPGEIVAEPTTEEVEETKKEVAEEKEIGELLEEKIPPSKSTYFYIIIFVLLIIVIFYAWKRLKK